jgi:hypothetical protein
MGMRANKKDERRPPAINLRDALIKRSEQRDELLASAFAFLAGAFINFINCTGKIGSKKLLRVTRMLINLENG